MSQSSTFSATYTDVDVAIVMRRVTADLMMIASSSGGVTEERARDWGHDIELLANGGYLRAVDITLSSAGIEQRAIRFEVKTESGQLTMSRPGGVLWPRLYQPDLRIVLFHTDLYDAAAKAQMSSKLRLSWTPTLANTSHSTLNAAAGRDYVSHGFGMQRKDFTK